MPRHSKEDIAEAKCTLQRYLKPSKGHVRQHVHMIVRHVSQTGMSRIISTYIADTDGDLVCLDNAISVVTGNRLDKHGGVRIMGCGMDMCFALLDHATGQAFPGTSANDYRIRHL